MNWLPVYIGLGVGAALLLLGVATGRWLKVQREIRERMGERPIPVEEVVARSLGRRDWLVEGARVVHDVERLGTVISTGRGGALAFVRFDSGVSRFLPAQSLDPAAGYEPALLELWARQAAAGIPNQNHRKD